MSKVQEEAVSLPAGPVDFDALSKALKEGKPGEQAVELATKNNPKPEEVDMAAVEAEKAKALAEANETATEPTAKPVVSASEKE